MAKSFIVICDLCGKSYNITRLAELLDDDDPDYDYTQEDTLEMVANWFFESGDLGAHICPVVEGI